MTSPNRSSIGVRVRPNAHDFIRDLNAQLKTKKSTFYVDVHAKTTQATTDVRKWAREQLPRINADVHVGANTGQATRDMRAWAAKANTKITVAIHANTTPATAQIKTWRQIAGQDLVIRVRADTSQLGLASLKRSLNSDAKIRVKADVTDAKREVAGIADDYGLFTVEVDADTKKAKVKAREFFDEVKGEQLEMDLGLDTAPAVAKAKAAKASIERDPVKAQLDLDTRKARLKLLELRILAKSRDLEVGVKLKKNSADSFGDALKGIEKSFGSFSFIRSLNLGPINLGKPTGLIGTVATITSLAGLLPGVVFGLSGLSKALTDVAGAAAIGPGAIAAFGASLATIGVGSIGISDAFGSMFDLWNEGASEQASSASNLVQAHNSYRNAVVDEAKAQKDVGRARKDALGDLRDLNNELRGGVLNEAQAILDVQKARERLAKGGFDSGSDRQQAQLDILQSEQNLAEVRERNIKTQDKANEANVNGVEGSDRVQDALEAQTRASQATAAAADALTTATTSGSTAATAYSEALARLAPNARDFVEAFAGAKSEVQGFQQEIQNIMFAGTAPAFKQLFANLMPVIGPGVRDIASELNKNILQVFDTLGSPDGQSIISRILGGTADSQAAIGRLIDPMVKGIGTLVAAGTEHLPQVIDLFTRLAERFENFITAADADGSLDKFMDDGVTALGNMAEIGLNLIKIVGNLGKAFDGDLLGSVSRITADWNKFLSSPEGQDKIKEFIKEARDIFSQWLPILEKIPGIFEAASTGAQNVLNVLTPFIEKFSWLLENAPGLVEAFIGAWLVSKFTVGVISPILTMITGLAKLPGIIRAIPALPAIPLPGVPGVGPGGAPVAPVGTGAGAAGGRVGNFLSAGTTLATAGALAPGLLASVAVPIAQAQPGAADVNSINSQLPAGTKPIAGTEKDRGLFQSFQMLADQGNPAAKWLMAAAGPQGPNAPGAIGADLIFTDPAAEKELARRYLWVATHPNETGDNFKPPASYMTGGYTDWGKKDGQLAILHGKEYVQPADTTAYYGVDTMKAIHEKKIPREFFTGFAGGDYVDPNDPRLRNPQPGIINSLVAHGTQGLNSVSSQVAPLLNGAGGTPGAPIGAAGTGMGPLPGPAPAPSFGMGLPGMPGTAAPAATMNLGPFSIPIGTAAESGWGPGGAPVGLGGGPDGYDMRTTGFGPGPVGSGPGDWQNFAMGQFSKLAEGVGTSLVSGLLGGLGLSGLSSYGSAISPLVDHFAAAGSGGGGNSDVAALMQTYQGMPGNPADGGAPGQMPGVFGPGGSALPNVGAGATGQGLQTNTAKGKAIIQQMFPWATNIGGVRADALKWHPSGLALDVMIPGQKGLNDPTTPQGLALGNQLYAWLKQHQTELGIDYMLWQQKDHYNHIHVNFAASGFGPGDGSLPSISPPSGGGFNPPGAPSAPPASRAAGESGPSVPKGWGLPAAGGPPPAGSPLGDLFLPTKTRDVGGWLPTGKTIVNNNTGGPELVLNRDQMKGLYDGGLPAGALIPPPKPNFQTPAVKPIIPPSTPAPAPVPAPTAPATPAITPAPGPPAPIGGTAPSPSSPAPQQAAPGPGGQPIDLTPRGASGASGGYTPPANGDHVHPALRKGITSGFAAAGSIAAMAISAAAAGATMGAGGGGGGALGSMVSGLFQQGGKIANNIANVGSSLLVGNITGGTTANAYGVTQRGNVPSGGSKVVDASQNHYGDINTNNLDELFARKRREDAVAAQSGLGRWGNA